jgi:hypothetical protein
MSEILAKEVMISVNMGTAAVADWKILGCSESDGFSGSTDTITISNKCEGSFAKNLPGDKSWSFANTMVIPKEPAVGFVSYDEMFELWKNDEFDADGELRQFKIENIPGTDFVYYRMGRGYVSDLGEQFDSGDVFRTDVTITGSGEVFNIQPT